MRNPGERFAELAKQNIVVLKEGNSGVEDRQRQGYQLCQLCDEKAVRQTFPPMLPGTLYHFFASTQSECAKAVVVVEDPDALADEAVFQAALGMMDNPIFR